MISEISKMNSFRKTAPVSKDKETELPNPEKCLLWKLNLKRKDAFEAMNSDVDEIVHQCLKARRHLQAVEDSNRNLHKEMRTLKQKYETLLEKNKNDTGIIMRLKDSESRLIEARKNREDANEALLSAKMTNEAKSLERKLLRDDVAKLLFKSQTISNSINKINLKHKRTHHMIEEEHKKGRENEKRLSQEIEELHLNLSRDDSILEKWQEDNTRRDDSIRSLRDDMKDGLTLKAQDQIDSKIIENSSNADISATDETETEQSTERSVSKEIDSNETKTDERAEQRKEVRREWSRKKVIYEAAEKEKEHWTDIFMLINKRMQDLSIEVVNVREWRIDIEVHKRELLGKVEELEQLVAQKRRNKPVPSRESMDELNIWIKVQRQANDTLRQIAFKYLSMKVEDWTMYSEFAKTIRDMYVNTLEKERILGEETEKTEEIEDET